PTRGVTPDDDKALKAAARTFPKTPFYDVEETLTTLGIGEAFVTVLSPKGVPTQPFAVRLIPPASIMGPLPDLDAQIARSTQVKKYAQDIDRESAREKLAARVVPGAAPGSSQPGDSGQSYAPPPAASAQSRRTTKQPPGTLEQIMKSPVTRTVAGAITRGLMGALLGSPRRRSTRSRW